MPLYTKTRKILNAQITADQKLAVLRGLRSARLSSLLCFALPRPARSQSNEFATFMQEGLKATRQYYRVRGNSRNFGCRALAIGSPRWGFGPRWLHRHVNCDGGGLAGTVFSMA